MRPLIGISCGYSNTGDRYQLARDYVLAVQAGGGIPLLLPHHPGVDIDRLLDTIDGLLLSGGGDLDPALFGEEPWPQNGNIDPDRDIFELQLARRAMDLKMPLLGICRGIQVMNVAAGGTVCQDIDRAIKQPVKHTQQAPRWHPTHSIKIKKHSTLFAILGSEELRVNSFHHQAIGIPAPCFEVVAASADGVPEGIETWAKDHFCIGVQFHPENLHGKHPLFLKLFTAHTAASSRYMSNKKPLSKKENDDGG